MKCGAASGDGDGGEKGEKSAASEPDAAALSLSPAASSWAPPLGTTTTPLLLLDEDGADAGSIGGGSGGGGETAALGSADDQAAALAAIRSMSVRPDSSLVAAREGGVTLSSRSIVWKGKGKTKDAGGLGTAAPGVDGETEAADGGAGGASGAGGAGMTAAPGGGSGPCDNDSDDDVPDGVAEAHDVLSVRHGMLDRLKGDPFPLANDTDTLAFPQAVVKGWFTMEDDQRVWKGRRVVVDSTGEEGVLVGGFAKMGKSKVDFPAGTRACEGASVTLYLTQLAANDATGRS